MILVVFHFVIVTIYYCVQYDIVIATTLLHQYLAICIFVRIHLFHWDLKWYHLQSVVNLKKNGWKGTAFFGNYNQLPFLKCWQLLLIIVSFGLIVLSIKFHQGFCMCIHEIVFWGKFHKTVVRYILGLSCILWLSCILGLSCISTLE